jgi:hypothetical protein
LVGLLRQSVFGRLAGYEDVNDADRLCRDPAMRWVVGGQAPMEPRQLARGISNLLDYTVSQRPMPK